MSSENNNKSSRRFYVICIAVTLVILLALLIAFQHQRSAVAPVYVLTVEGLNAETPAEAQAQCRSENQRCLELMDGKNDCVWVWCGDNELFLVRSKALNIDPEQSAAGFTSVIFLDEKGKENKGFIIDPTSDSAELGRIIISDGDEYSFDSVSMSIRVSLRKGDIQFQNAVYLWEKGNNTVFAVKEGSYTVIEDNIVSFIDDGGVTRVCYILDTKLD